MKSLIVYVLSKNHACIIYYRLSDLRLIACYFFNERFYKIGDFGEIIDRLCVIFKLFRELFMIA